MNGIDCASVPVKKHKNTGRITFIAVAAIFCNWHAFERLIEGLRDYYKSGSSITVCLKLVGSQEGAEFALYKKLAERYDLTEYISFEGFLSGDQLDAAFDESDIAACGLGCHRKNIFLSSELKSREYLARGLPMLGSTKIDVLPENFPYCLYVPEDDSPINIRQVIAFYEGLLKTESAKGVTDTIRRFAEEHCDMAVTMKPVIEYIRTIKEEINT
jgi:glycosyltransferase involved in cell wall biosynthesis